MISSYTDYILNILDLGLYTCIRVHLVRVTLLETRFGIANGFMPTHDGLFTRQGCIDGLELFMMGSFFKSLIVLPAEGVGIWVDTGTLNPKP